MAEEKNPKPVEQPAAAPQAAPEPEPEMASNETISGGKYLQGDQLVNAWGEPIDSKGNVKKDS